MTARPNTSGQKHLAAPSNALRGVQRDYDPFTSTSFSGLGHDAADNLSLVVWSLFLSLVFLVPLIIAVFIRQFS